MNVTTKATANILKAIDSALSCSYLTPEVAKDSILSRAQELVSNDGYSFDVALAIACKAYPVTSHCGLYAFAK